uniref:Reverse transcriptase domain-containing protein n=1 Tax=Amphimedon queenslandica TaxID=400682 RepID=A0A1X7UKT8_AMPQE
MPALLAPRQLGYCVKGGAESAVHAARWYLKSLRPSQAILKLDFRNAFNSICRDRMLRSVLELSLTIYPFVHSCYSAPSSLFWEGRVLKSAEG